MIARVLRTQVEPDRIDAVLAAYQQHVRPIHDAAAGLRSHYVLVDRETGRIEIVGIWQDEAAIQAVAPVLEPARRRLWDAFGQEPELELFTVGDELSH